MTRCVEKPEAERSKRYLADGYLWNSGNFLFRATTFLRELGRLQPDILDAVHKAHEEASAALGFLRLSPSISVDYTVMEGADRAAVLPIGYRWPGIGS